MDEPAAVLRIGVHALAADHGKPSAISWGHNTDFSGNELEAMAATCATRVFHLLKSAVQQPSFSSVAFIIYPCCFALPSLLMRWQSHASMCAPGRPLTATFSPTTILINCARKFERRNTPSLAPTLSIPTLLWRPRMA